METKRKKPRILKIFAALIALLIATIVIPAGAELYNLYYRPNPVIDDLVGMSRLEVVDWLDKNGRVHNLYGENDKNNGKIYLAFDHAHDTFKTKEELLQNEFVMEQETWELGFQSICRGRIFSSIIRFKDDKVVSQQNVSNIDF